MDVETGSDHAEICASAEAAIAGVTEGLNRPPRAVRSDAVTFAEFSEAADKLSASGDLSLVTLRGVRAIIGRGSMGTLNTLLREWRARRSLVGTIGREINPDAQSKLQSAVRSAIEAAVLADRENTRAALEETRDALSRAENEVSAAYKNYDELQEETDRLAARVSLLEGEGLAAEQTAAQTAVEMKAAQAASVALKERLVAMIAERDHLVEENTSRITELLRAEASVTELGAELAAVRAQAAETASEAQSLASELADADNLLSTTREDLDKAAGRLGDLTARLAAEENERRKTTAALTAATEMTVTLNSRIADLTRGLEAAVAAQVRLSNESQELRQALAGSMATAAALAEAKMEAISRTASAEAINVELRAELSASAAALHEIGLKEAEGRNREAVQADRLHDIQASLTATKVAAETARKEAVEVAAAASATRAEAAAATGLVAELRAQIASLGLLRDASMADRVRSEIQIEDLMAKITAERDLRIKAEADSAAARAKLGTPASGTSSSSNDS